MAIAAVLKRSGKLTVRGSTWTKTTVCGLRKTNDIPVCPKANELSAARSPLMKPLIAAGGN